MSEGYAELAPTLAWASWKSWLWEHDSKGANPSLHQLQYSGDQPPYVAEVASLWTRGYECGKDGSAVW